MEKYQIYVFTTDRQTFCVVFWRKFEHKRQCTNNETLRLVYQTNVAIKRQLKLLHISECQFAHACTWVQKWLRVWVRESIGMRLRACSLFSMQRA